MQRLGGELSAERGSLRELQVQHGDEATLPQDLQAVLGALRFNIDVE